MKRTRRLQVTLRQALVLTQIIETPTQVTVITKWETNRTSHTN